MFVAFRKDSSDPQMRAVLLALWLLLLTGSAVLTSASQGVYEQIVELLGESLVEEMDQLVDEWTIELGQNGLSGLLYTCIEKPKDRRCRSHSCRVTQKEHPRLDSIIVRCKVAGPVRRHELLWLVGTTHRCVYVRLDERVLFDRCYGEGGKISSSTNVLISTTTTTTGSSASVTTMKTFNIGSPSAGHSCATQSVPPSIFSSAI